MLYWIGWTVFNAIFRLCFRWRVVGTGHVPPQGPAILASNHISWWDPPLIGCAVRRPVHFMAKEELFRIRIVGWILSRLHAIPIRRGEADLSNLRRMLEALQRGNVVGIFPEGTRRRDGALGEPQPGTAWLAHRARALVVPMAIIGRYRFRQPLTVRIGPPIDLGQALPERPRTADLIAATRRVMDAIAALQAAGHASVGR